MRTVLLPLLLVAACASGALADASLYLYPRAAHKAGGLSFSDVAIIEADADTSARIGAAAVDGALLADGYLDASEVQGALEGMVPGRLSIYGSGVRVSGAAAERQKPGAPVAVKKGAQVRFHVMHARVCVETTGTALEDGAVGDVIPVRLRGRSVSRGTIMNERDVELEL